MIEGTTSASGCFFVSVGVDRVWFSGVVLNVDASWVFRPSIFSDVNDIIALFKLDPESAHPRQLDWSYTSTVDASVSHRFSLYSVLAADCDLARASDFGSTLQQDVQGSSGWSADPAGPLPIPVGSKTFRVPSAGAGAYSVRLFSNSSSPGLGFLAPPPIPPGGAVVAASAFTLGAAGSGSTYEFGGDGVPPDLHLSVAGNAGLVCAAGSYSLVSRGAGWPPCSPCLAGTYAAADGMTTCSQCLNRTYAAAAGSTACLRCGAKSCCGPGCLSVSAAYNTTATRAISLQSTQAASTTNGPPTTAFNPDTNPVASDTTSSSGAGNDAAPGGSGSNGQAGGALGQTCGDGILSRYPTRCWTDDRGGELPSRRRMAVAHGAACAEIGDACRPHIFAAEAV